MVTLHKSHKIFQSIMRKKGISKVLFFNFDDKPNPNFYYFTSYSGFGIYIIPKIGEPLLIVPGIEAENAKKTKNKIIVSTKKPFFDVLKKYCKCEKIGLDYDNITLNMYKSLKKNLKKIFFNDISDLCYSIREIKSNQEIKYLKKACNISDKILEKCFNNFKKFKTELEITDFLSEETKKYNCDFSFFPIVASGTNSSCPHHNATGLRIKKGFCVIDFGVKYKGYCSDTTRVLYVGTPSRDELKLYNLLLEVQENTVAQCVHNASCSEIFDFCIDKLGVYSKNFTHGLGHGVGLKIHELPNLKYNSKDVLKKGFVLTVEPGVYFKNKFGIRIEDTILINEGKPQILTRISKKLRIIK